MKNLNKRVDRMHLEVCITFGWAQGVRDSLAPVGEFASHQISARLQRTFHRTEICDEGLKEPNYSLKCP